ncbi:RNA polymerase sigma factor (sigma-70 family) [Paenibacillus sp. DS2015]|uniref:sigma-70 family RNA polymerase sigma factor n=1 Tax=Paenibacillus sp. DS2015 TaxID=3373917 RepID=UPI003D2013BB
MTLEDEKSGTSAKVDQMLVRIFTEQLLEDEWKELYQALWTRYSPMIMKRLRSDYAVNEVFQDWMIALYQASNKKIPDNPVGYSMQILLNKIVRYIRKQIEYRQHEVELETAATKYTEEEVWVFGNTVDTSNMLFRLHIQESLSKLSETGRQYFILHNYCGYTCKEIAYFYDDTFAAVTKRIQRTKKKILTSFYHVNTNLIIPKSSS